ncbi:MAG: hypothetical protein K2Y51_22610 [Gammaproteobacteria bacterium]|nr:hypothetical protein [Gammaproteobacteria bacterium]
MKRIATVLLVLTSLHASGVSAEFRGGQPPVLSAAPTPVVDQGEAVISRFRARYQAAKAPALALFWNRELSDSIAQRTVQRSTTSSSKSESVANAAGNGEGRSEKLEQATASTVNAVEVLDDNAHPTLDPRSDALLKTTFLAVLQRGGARIVDRALMVRAAAAGAPSGVDAQVNEMRGLAERAAWLLEVTLVPDERAPLGHAFRVAVKDVGQGTVIAEMYTPAIPPARAPAGLVAMNGVGFVRAPAPAPSVGDVGRTLGVEVLDRLSQAL